MSTNYTPQSWANGSGGGTPLSATRMAYLESGVEAVDNAAAQKATLTTKGDMYAATGTSAPARVAVGGNGTELRADSAQTTGVGWKRHRAPSSDKTTSYTLVAADVGTKVVMNAAGAVNLTVPNSVFSAGDVVEVWQRGAGQVTVVAGTGTTMRSPLGTKTRAQYSTVRIWFFTASEFVVDLDAVV